MVDDVDIKNVGGKYGVASEATMQLILAQLGGSGSAAGSRAQRLADASQQRITRANTGAAASSGILSKTFKGAAGAVGGFASTLMSTNNRLSDFSKNILGDSNLFSRSINMLTGYLDDSLDSLRELSSVGASFNNSIFDMQLAAAQGEMSFSNFTSMVKQNSSVLALLGGTVGKGAEQLALFTKGIRKSDAGKQLMGMGFTIEDINEGLVDYLDIQMQSGNKINLRDKKLIAGSEAYLKQIDGLAKVTGKSRDQISKDLIAQQQDVGIRNQINNLQGKERENFQNTLAVINTSLPALSSGLIDMADGYAQTPLGQIMASQIQGLGPLMQRQFSGQISEVDFQNELRKLQPEIDKFQKQYGKEIFDALRSGGGMGAAYAEVADGMNQLNAFLNQNLEQLKKEQEKRSMLTELIGTFEQTVQSVKSSLSTAFINSAAFNALSMLGVKLLEVVTPGSGTMDSFSDKLVYAADFLLGEQGILTKAINIAITEIDEFATLVKEGGFLHAFETKLSELGDWVTKWFKDIFYGSDKIVKVPAGDKVAHQKGLFAQMIDSISAFWEGDMMTSLKDTIGEYFKSLIQTMEDSFVNSTFVATLLGIDREEVAARQSQAAIEARASGRKPVAIDVENALTAALGTGIFNMSEVDGAESVGGKVYYDALMKQLSTTEQNARGGGKIEKAIERLGAKYKEGSASEPERQLFEKVIANLTSENQLATGTSGFKNFGTESPAMLHGVEAVVPRNTMAGNMLAKTFGDDWNNPKAVTQIQGSQENTAKYIIQLNSTMLMVLDELRKGNDLEKKTLNSVKGLSGDLYRAV
jgi:hypothetical protein